MDNKECAKCIHNAVCETAKACDGFVYGCKHFKEQKKGRWDDSFDGITPYCTACGRSHNCMNRTPNFCPNCGADMRGEDK